MDEHIEGGFVIIARKTTRSSLWKMPPKERILAITLICESNYQDQKWFDRWQGREIIIRRGEIVTSIQNLSDKANLPIRTTRTALTNLTKSGFCDNITAKEPKLAKGYTHLRVHKFNKYQDIANYVGAILTKRRQTTAKGLPNDRHISKQDKHLKHGKNKPSCQNESPESINPDSQIQTVVNLWNSICTNLPKIRTLGEQRRRNILNRLKEHPNFGDWQAIFEWLNRSPHHTGKNDRKWVATIDFIIERGKGAKFNEILEKAGHRIPDSSPDSDDDSDEPEVDFEGFVGESDVKTQTQISELTLRQAAEMERREKLKNP